GARAFVPVRGGRSPLPVAPGAQRRPDTEVVHTAREARRAPSILTFCHAPARHLRSSGSIARRPTGLRLRAVERATGRTGHGTMLTLLLACGAVASVQDPVAEPPAGKPDLAVVVYSTRGDEKVHLAAANDLSPLGSYAAGAGAHELAISPDGRWLI